MAEHGQREKDLATANIVMPATSTIPKAQHARPGVAIIAETGADCQIAAISNKSKKKKGAHMASIF